MLVAGSSFHLYIAGALLLWLSLFFIPVLVGTIYSYEGVALDNSSENAVTEMSVTFAYDKFVPEGPLSSTGSAIRSAINTII